MATIYTGTYGSGTTAENALNTALMQYPEIARTLVKQYPRCLLYTSPSPRDS